MKANIFVTLLLLLSPCAVVDAWESGPHCFSLGPQFDFLERDRQGGTFQDGWLYGGCFTYQRLCWNGFYWGGDVRVSSGTLQGNTSSGAAIKSRFNECEIQGYLGWTLGLHLLKDFSITPFIGGGYFRAVNDFKPPSPLTLRFQDTYSFPLVGVLCVLYLNSNFSIGVDARAKWMSDARERVTGDEEMGKVLLRIGDNWLYEVQLPFTYNFQWCSMYWNASIVPFWEKRDYGGREGFPLDFIETRYNAYGMRLLIGICL